MPFHDIKLIFQGLGRLIPPFYMFLSLSCLVILAEKFLGPNVYVMYKKT
jgi:hypothetical protein